MSKRHDEDEDENARITRSLAGLAVILFLAVAIVFVVQKLRAISNIQDCFMSGRTNCLPIDTSKEAQ